MSGGKQVFFPPFTLDTSNECPQRGPEKLFLRPKSLAVLAYLVEHPRRLVTKEELMAAVWPKAKVVDTALRVSIQEIRKVLGDEAGRPKFIETAGKKGYRFIAPVSLRLAEAGRESFLPFVGRSSGLDRLRDHLEIASGGKRQIVFVTGEPGIGKTTLVETFIQSLPTTDKVVTTHGQCIEQYGSGEAYMPILDALERMCNGPNGEPAAEALRRHAPSWLVNLSALATSEERSELERQNLGITPERRLREMAAFLEAMAEKQTVLLLLEDLHWADPSTLTLISFLARRREAARLMLIGTYREGEVERLNHPLKTTKQELQLHDLCKHLPLKFLTRGAVGEYLAARFETPNVSSKVLSTVYRRSEGNPLFMVNVTDYLVTQEAIVQQNNSVELTNGGVKELAPTNIHELIERQFESLDPEDQRLLEVGSVAGMSFSAAAVAAGLGRPVEQVEDRCEKLVEHEQFLQASGTSQWPDGTIASRYGFIHALYENEIYERLSDSRRARLHQTLGERMRPHIKTLRVKWRRN